MYDVALVKLGLGSFGSFLKLYWLILEKKSGNPDFYVQSCNDSLPFNIHVYMYIDLLF